MAIIRLDRLTNRQIDREIDYPDRIKNITEENAK